MSEAEWRNLGVQQSPGWIHYMTHEPEPHILLFRRPVTRSTSFLRRKNFSKKESVFIEIQSFHPLSLFRPYTVLSATFSNQIDCEIVSLYFVGPFHCFNFSRYYVDKFCKYKCLNLKLFCISVILLI